MARKAFGKWLLPALLCSLIGCATGRQPVDPAPRASMPPPAAPAVTVSPAVTASAEPTNHDGSLWQSDSDFAYLFTGIKASRVGDNVTINIVESSKATNQATTKTGRASDLQAGIDTLFGLEDWYQNEVLSYSNKLPKINPFGTPSVKGSMASTFNGSGTTSRSGDLTAYMTAQITEILPGGNFRIVGSREVMVNNENQLIILSGIVRPRDISPDNIILSTYIADAKIAYSGTGIVDDRQRPGWLANLLNQLWPF
jgi:flagellar L-ring protein precursor FlgH